MITFKYLLTKTSFLLLVFVLFFTACKSDKKPEQPVIDPKDVIIDVSMGGYKMPDGVLLPFKKSGKGEKVLIIPNYTYLEYGLGALEKDFTLIYYDLRNRGRSKHLTKPALLAKGILQDVEDLENIRKQLKLEKINIIGHDYLGLMANVYAMKYPDRVNRIVQIAPVPPFVNQKYSVYKDSVNTIVNNGMMVLEQKRASLSAKEYCEEWWTLMKMMHVANPEDVMKLRMQFCFYPSEQPTNLMRHLNEYVNASIAALEYEKQDFNQILAAQLIFHGTKDRMASLEGAKEWKNVLSNAQFIELENAGHFPWVESGPELMEAIKTFFNLKTK